MIVLGLTGSIGMGKSTAAAMLRRLGLPVHDADAEVHRLYAEGGAAVVPVAAAFPAAARDGAIDRAVLRDIVQRDQTALPRLEAIVHPLVRKAERRFLRRARAAGAPLAVLDIPLLFETGGESRCDAIVVVTAPRAVQLGRVLRRPAMTPERLAALEARQMPDAEKRRRADFVVQTGLGKRVTLQALREVAKILTGAAEAME